MGRKEDLVWIEFATIRPKDSAKPHPNVACNYCQEAFMNAQPSRHLYPHLRRSANQEYDSSSPSKRQRIGYEESSQMPSPTTEVSKAEEESFNVELLQFSSLTSFKLELFAEILKKAVKGSPLCVQAVRSCSLPPVTAIEVRKIGELAAPVSTRCSRKLVEAPEYTTDIAGSARNTVQNDIRRLISSSWNFIRPPSDSTTIAYILDPSKDITTLPKRLPGGKSQE
ncbi:hypothetical protein GQ600_7855 [Phytophthora cactorum]|nr:hypothetical protein GQ600_7855 [Phytophthora cactorum]